MKKITKLLSFVFVLGMLASCTITMPITATSNAVGSKVGTASATVILSVFAFDQDASIRSAAKDGGITKISTVDMKTKNVLGIITTYETIVTGE